MHFVAFHTSNARQQVNREIYGLCAGGIQAAYSGMVPFTQRDGLLFLNKEAHYDLGPSPLALVWKDACTSRYFLDTDASGVVPKWQHVVLQCLDSGHLGTGDEPPVVIGTLPNDLGDEAGQIRCAETALKHSLLAIFPMSGGCAFC